jgi:hypothetical protein
MDKPRIVRRAEDKLDELTEPEHERKYASGPGPAQGDDLVREQTLELEQSWAAPGLPVMTDSMFKGLLFGSIVGGAIGILVFLPVAFIPFGGLAVGWRILVVAIVGALAGGTAGAIYFGGRLPELEGETAEADGRPGVGTTPRDPGTDERGR